MIDHLKVTIEDFEEAYDQVTPGSKRIDYKNSVVVNEMESEDLWVGMVKKDEINSADNKALRLSDGSVAWHGFCHGYQSDNKRYGICTVIDD